MTGILATAEIDIAAAPETVWVALTDPAQITQYMFGTTVKSDWRPGSPITWSGEYNDQPYEDSGEVIAVDPPRRLEVTHSSGGNPEKHTLTYVLTETGEGTHVRLTQDGNADAEAAGHATANWQTMLEGLQRHIEG